MGDEFFSRGAGEALKALGLMSDDVAYALARRQSRKTAAPMPPTEGGDQHGAPFPEKSMNIGAERFARLLRNLDDEGLKGRSNPDNANYAYTNNLDRLTTWGGSTHVEEGRSSGGLMVPANPRG
jgi:hypothetical protein